MDYIQCMLKEIEIKTISAINHVYDNSQCSTLNDLYEIKGLIKSINMLLKSKGEDK
ncbi:hypothetical protein [Clostridium butyricum]|uniref:hypothetical protein n=1 Tax=Clostridium butyricum TaxID=1492 RepID=UPI00325C27BF